MPRSEFRIVFDICLFLNGEWGSDGKNGFLFQAAPVGKCFFLLQTLFNK